MRLQLPNIDIELICYRQLKKMFTVFISSMKITLLNFHDMKQIDNCVSIISYGPSLVSMLFLYDRGLSFVMQLVMHEKLTTETIPKPCSSEPTRHCGKIHRWHPNWSFENPAALEKTTIDNNQNNIYYATSNSFHDCRPGIACKLKML